MSVESLAVVLHHSKASGTDKLVLIGIANHDGDGGAWPSVGTLAKYANVSPRSVNRSLDKLRELGEVIVYLQAGGTRHTADHKRPNRYEVLVKCPEGCDRTSAHRVKAVDKSEELPLELVDKRKSKPLTHTSPPDAHVTRTIITNHPGNSSFASPSPADTHTCWACGQPNHNGRKYCTPCSNRGMDNDMINCRTCNRTRRRHIAGQQFFDCTDCQRKEKASNDE